MKSTFAKEGMVKRHSWCILFGNKENEIKQVKKGENLQRYSEKAQEILQIIIDKYIEYGASELSADIIKVHPISEKGTVFEIAEEFGGVNELKTAIYNLQQMIYAA